MKRISLSLIGSEIAPAIKQFLLDNARTKQEDKTLEEGCEDLANAIAYGVAKAMTSPQWQALMATVIAVAPSTPVGTIMTNAVFTPLFTEAPAPPPTISV